MQLMSNANANGVRERLRAAGESYLHDLGPGLSAADPEGTVTPRSRMLCASLGQLGVLAHEALGGRRHSATSREVGVAAAALSLLTKIDDEVIDQRAFHGGMTASRRSVRDRTEAFLAPTLASLGSGLAATDEPRCVYAASVGRRLAELAGSRVRLDHVLAVIAEGWRTQVDAVVTLSSHPGEVSLAEVAGVTRRISGVWLLMIALVGTLPDDAGRTFTSDEEEAIHDWGFHIQRTDALADLQKDVDDGLTSSFAGRILWEREPSRYLPACRARDARTLYDMLARHRVDDACLRGGEPHQNLATRLRGLGEIHPLLAWIHGFLLDRYLTHPLCRRTPEDLTYPSAARPCATTTPIPCPSDARASDARAPDACVPERLPPATSRAATRA
ncbi:hypothetical protein [Chondromyces apiculatus]|uniref:Uncharacterized protein n=1 Tax=Chondromyces apiculatus DSM 436 TaxID=1192034 RepID=A0A017T584_9BACT|nr:hypothetical protein [Chondromyces apiculatus]EYF04147.1 Hypothetical protein CAP_4830 [Chondromyces apiculatus DSM 436]